MPKFKSKIWFFKILFKNNNLKNYEDSKIAPFLSCLSVVIFNYMKVKNISRTRCCHLIRNIGNLTECHAIYLFELYIIKKATRPITIYLAFWILSRIFFLSKLRQKQLWRMRSWPARTFRLWVLPAPDTLVCRPSRRVSHLSVVSVIKLFLFATSDPWPVL